MGKWIVISSGSSWFLELPDNKGNIIIETYRIPTQPISCPDEAHPLRRPVCTHLQRSDRGPSRFDFHELNFDFGHILAFVYRGPRGRP
jgi:hypothetical protein